ncbi:MAG: ferredoxin-type protein NapF [Parashewanella sp.]
MASGFSHSRRRLFRRRNDDTIRPPWVKDDIDFVDLCSRCDKCISACETQIIFKGDGGFPEINFNKDECTFCQQCANVCPEQIFDTQQPKPWSLVAKVQPACLANNGVWCQSCKDACEPEAISFAYLLGKTPFPEVDTDLCTGCGACLSLCPNNSILLNKQD